MVLHFFTTASSATDFCDTVDAWVDSVTVEACARVVLTALTLAVLVVTVGIAILLTVVVFCFDAVSIMICRQSAMKVHAY